MRWNSYWGKAYLEPRFNGRIQLIEDQSLYLKGDYGVYYQFLNQIQRPNQLRLGEKVWIASIDEEVPAVKSRQWTIGGLWKSRGWRLELDIYEKKLSNISILNQLENGKLSSR